MESKRRPEDSGSRNFHDMVLECDSAPAITPDTQVSAPNSDIPEPRGVSSLLLVLLKFAKYIGPGLMVSVAYMDPGNFSSSIASAQFQYKLLFSLLVSNLMAGFLQVLAGKLGICTGEDLAANCRKHLNPRLNYTIYVFAEISVIATDVAEIIGTAIAFNIIFGMPLVWGVLLTVVDVLFVIMAYRPNGPILLLRIFEGFVSLLVLGTVVCFAIELANVSPTTNWGDVALGFVPSREVFSDINGIYLSAALLGSNLMPHSLYLGSGVVQARMKSFDAKLGHYVPPEAKREGSLFFFTRKEEIDEEPPQYKPSLQAINETMSFTVAELVVSLIFVALFVNAAILIVAGSALSKPLDDDGDGALETADLFTLHQLLTTHLSPAAGAVFAFALLFSGLCGGTVVTIAGQMIMEGHAKVTVPPGLKRIITRAVALVPCIAVVLTNGREGLSTVLNASQVVLSFMLPFVSAPLIYFTSSRHIMKVPLLHETETESPTDIELDSLSDAGLQPRSSHALNTYQRLPDNMLLSPSGTLYKDMSNSMATTTIATIFWALISFLNFWLLLSMALGRDVPI